MPDPAQPAQPSPQPAQPSPRPAQPAQPSPQSPQPAQPSAQPAQPTDPQPYRVEVPLRWSDMDAYGHVNNVQYLRLLEDARVIGFGVWFPERPSMLDEGIVVSRHAIEYRAPLTYRPEPVEVDMWVTHVHGAGFDLGYTVRDPQGVGEQVYAVAETGLVVYDFENARPRRLSATAREQLAAHRGEPVRFRWVNR